CQLGCNSNAETRRARRNAEGDWSRLNPWECSEAAIRIVRGSFFRDVPSGDFQEIGIGIKEVERVCNFVVAKFEGDAASLEFSLGRLEIGVGCRAKAHVPGATVGRGRLVFFFGK